MDSFDTIFKTIDTSNSGKIDFNGFLEASSIFGWKICREPLLIAFSKYDHGTVPSDQFKSFMDSISQNIIFRIPLADLKERLLLNSSLQHVFSRTQRIRSKQGFLCDMDGVVYRGGRLIPGIIPFIEWIRRTNKKLLFLTNTSCLTQAQLHEKLRKIGLDIPPDMFFTAAMSTAEFLSMQNPNGCSVYMIGDEGLREAFTNKGIVITDQNPDYVVIGESHSITNQMINMATNLVHKGAKLIGCNVDAFDPVEDGIIPSCGAWTSVIEVATGKKAYFCGKPNPFLMRAALNKLGCHTDGVSIIGDRMDTDVLAGLESMLEPILVLSGVTTKESILNYSYRPFLVVNDVGDIPEHEIFLNEKKIEKL